MERKALVRLLKAIVILLSVLLSIFYIYIAPHMVSVMCIQASKELYNIPILIAVFLSAPAIVIAFVSFWRICTAIGEDKSFCRENARRLERIALCAFIDSAYCLAFAVAMSILRLMSVSYALKTIALAIAGTAVALASSLLSHLVMKAHTIQQENDLTV